jgi:hypothetical protein
VIVWARAGVASLALLLARAGALATPAPGAAGDTLAGRPIGRVDVVTRNVYEPLPAGRLAPLYDLVNHLHARTRPGTIRQELLLGAGQPWSPARVAETERKLRALDYIDSVGVQPRAGGDSVQVEVLTRDAWSTITEVNLQGGGGARTGSVVFTERNLLGFGKALSFAYREEPRDISRALSFVDPNFLGTRWQGSAAVADGTQGASSGAWLGLPFYAEDAPRSLGARAERATSRAELFRAGELAAGFDRRLEEVEAWWGSGRRVQGTVVRLIHRLELLDRRFGPSDLEPGAPPQFAGGDEPLRLHRVSTELVLWSPRFIQREAVELLDRVEDVDLGPRFSLRLGVAPRFLGSDVDEGFGQLRLQLGGELRGRSFWQAAGQASSRTRPAPIESDNRVQARVVSQVLPRQTLLLAAWGAAAYRPPRDLQYVAGGLSGLRGFDPEAIAGGQVWRLNLEDRVLIARGLADLVSIGGAAFLDAARSWGPGSDGTEWHSDVGFGLRLSLPRQGVARIARLDLAWPLRPRPSEGRRWVVSFGSRQAF